MINVAKTYFFSNRNTLLEHPALSVATAAQKSCLRRLMDGFNRKGSPAAVTARTWLLVVVRFRPLPDVSDYGQPVA